MALQAIVNGVLVDLDPAEETRILAEREGLFLAAFETEIDEGAEKRLNNFANTRGYKNIDSLCSYAQSTVPKLATEGSYGLVIRDATWNKIIEILAEVAAGTRQRPANFEEIEPELPVLMWPE